jgi:hypothetical protein
LLTVRVFLILMCSGSVGFAQSGAATSTVSPSPLSTPVRNPQNGRPMQPDISLIAAPSSQDAINPCEVTTASSAIPPSSYSALTRSQSSHTSSLDSDSGSDLQQGNFSNPKRRRRATKSGSTVLKRLRVSQKNPSHGMVEGAMIGNKVFGELSIACSTHSLIHFLHRRPQTATSSPSGGRQIKGQPTICTSDQGYYIQSTSILCDNLCR